MTRTYHIDIAAFAANADRKWVDNLISHFDLVGVERARRGVARRITVAGLYQITLVRRLNMDFGISIAQAVQVADRLLRQAEGAVVITPGLELVFQRVSFAAGVDARIAEAVETFRPAPRGRPPVRRLDATRLGDL